MKKVLLFCLLSFASRAQELTRPNTFISYPHSYARGTWSAGLQAGYSKGLFLGRNLTTHAHLGYFVANKLLLGVGATASQEGFRNVQDLTYSVGPLIRYQFTRSRISPFLTASYQLGQEIISGSESQITTQVVQTSTGPVTVTTGYRIQGSGKAERIFSRSVGAGLSGGVSPALRIDLLLNWQDKVSTVGYPIRFENGFYQAQLGVSYLFGYRK